MSETESEYSEAMKESTPSLTSSASLGRVITARSEHSATDPKTAIPSSGEDFVNVAAVSFLATLTMGGLQTGQAGMGGIQTQVRCAVGRSLDTDGRLCSRSRTDIHAIVEVKPFVLT